MPTLDERMRKSPIAARQCIEAAPEGYERVMVSRSDSGFRVPSIGDYMVWPVTGKVVDVEDGWAFVRRWEKRKGRGRIEMDESVYWDAGDPIVIQRRKPVSNRTGVTTSRQYKRAVAHAI